MWDPLPPTEIPSPNSLRKFLFFGFDPVEDDKGKDETGCFKKRSKEAAGAGEGGEGVPQPPVLPVGTEMLATPAGVPRRLRVAGTVWAKGEAETGLFMC